MRKTLGKKAGIPAINEVVLTILHTMPTPIKIFIFILLISLIASTLLPIMLSFFGYECVIDGSGTLQLYQVPVQNILPLGVSNLKQTVRNFVGLKDYQLPEDPFPNGDTRFVKIPDECFVTTQVNGSSYTGYMPACVDCQTSGGWFSQFFVPINEMVCLSDGFYQAPTWSLSVTYKNLCFVCSPPNPYYYNHTNALNMGGYFTIINETDAPNIISTDYQANYYYQQIVNLGGVKKTQDTTEVTSLQCVANGRPELYFFNIKVMDKMLWIYLYGAYWLLVFAGWWYRLMLK